MSYEMDGVRHVGSIGAYAGGRLTRETFTTKVMPAFGLGLAMTAAGAYLGTRIDPVLLLPIVLVELLLVFTSGMWQRKEGLNKIMFFAYTICSGMTLVPLLHWAALRGGISIIIQALVVSAVTFGGCAVYGLTTKRDLSGVGGFLMLTCLGLLVTLLLNIWLQSSVLAMACTVLGVGMFSAFVVYDTNQIRNNYLDADYMGAALALYIDFIGLFTYVLRFLGMFSSNDD